MYFRHKDATKTKSSMKKKEYNFQINGNTTTVSSPDYIQHTVPTVEANRTAIKVQIGRAHV